MLFGKNRREFKINIRLELRFYEFRNARFSI